MIKVVATKDGVAAVEALIAEGVNINITLIFSLAHYEAVAGAYIRGLRRCKSPERVASVASFFVSRVDTQVDKALDAIGSPAALALRGKIAIANAKAMYRRFREIFHGDEFGSLRQKGARAQRPLWASTGTKNPAYSDVRYVEELIGPDTVNTIPPDTLAAFRDHGRVRGDTVLENGRGGEPASRAFQPGHRSERDHRQAPGGRGGLLSRRPTIACWMRLGRSAVDAACLGMKPGEAIERRHSVGLGSKRWQKTKRRR